MVIMRRFVFVFTLWCLAFCGGAIALAPPDFSGEIEPQMSFDLDGSEIIWASMGCRLKLDSRLTDNAGAYFNLRIYGAASSEASQLDCKISEAYVDYSSGSFDLRAGQQIFSWGTAYLINPTNNLNPYDLNEQAIFIPEERLGVMALRLKYYPAANLILTGVYIPYFVPALEMAGLPVPENSEYALKLTAQAIRGCDYSVSYFKGYEDYPSAAGQYRNVEFYGGDVIGTLGEIALWAEGSQARPENGDPYFQLAAGGEYTFENDLYCLGQVYLRNFSDSKENYLMAVLRGPYRDIHTLQLGMAYEADKAIIIIFPEVTISLSDMTSLVLSGISVKGDVSGTFISQLKDKFIIRLEYSF